MSINFWTACRLEAIYWPDSWLIRTWRLLVAQLEVALASPSLTSSLGVRIWDPYPSRYFPRQRSAWRSHALFQLWGWFYVLVNLHWCVSTQLWVQGQFGGCWAGSDRNLRDSEENPDLITFYSEKKLQHNWQCQRNSYANPQEKIRVTCLASLFQLYIFIIGY